jgi:hypothetical protein
VEALQRQLQQMVIQLPAPLKVIFIVVVFILMELMIDLQQILGVEGCLMIFV